MTFEVELHGRTRTVSIERTDRPDRFRVSVDGRALVVDAIRTSEFGLSLLMGSDAGTQNRGTVPFSAPERPEEGTATPSGVPAVPTSVEVSLTPGTAYGELLLGLGGRTTTATVNGRRSGHATDTRAHAHGEIAITAPMPGRVVRVLVQPGEEISARQGVVVVEAMKMENELRAPRAGRVKEITVQPGASVESGRVLAVIE